MEPVIGIVTVNQRQGELGGNKANFLRIWRAAAKVGVQCPVFAIEPDGHVHAYCPLSRGQFTEMKAAVPKVLYNRIATRRQERATRVKEQFHQWQEAGVLITNPRFLCKDEVLQQWQEEPLLRPYVPHAERLTTVEQALEFMDRYHTVYAKPVDGKAGEGIIQLERSDQGVVMRLQQTGQARRFARVSQAEAARRLLVRNKTARYVLQAGADVLRYQGRQFDFRILTQAMPGGQMAITGTGIRLGPDNGITTHVPNGGKVVTPETFLPKLFGRQAAAIQAQVETVALQAASALTRQTGTWCELSLDIGMTKAGEPCLFEANAKPMKFDEPRIEKTAKERLVAYLISL